MNDYDRPLVRSLARTAHLFTCSELLAALAVHDMNAPISFIFNLFSFCFRRYHVSGFETCVGCIDFWFNKEDLNQAIMLLGDNLGNVTVIVWHQALHGSGLFTKTSS